MAASLNVWTFTGRLGADAEVKTVGGGKTVVEFRVALDYLKGGETKTHWVSCAWWGDRGSKVSQYLRKGTPVTVTGRAGMDEYTTRDGKPGAKLVCDVSDVALQGGKGDSAGSGSPRPTGNRGPVGTSTSDDEIPF